MLNKIVESNPQLEAKARAAAKKAGCRAEKSRLRKYLHSNNQGGWQVIENYSNTVLAGVDYELTAEEVIEFCAGVQK